jgi:regulator of sirC expression with transglutaminase-like and TPR domain
MLSIGMPGHFLMRPDFEDAGIFVDAFNHGEILFPQDCQERLTQIYGRTVPLLPEFLEPITPQQFLARMLTILKMIYLNRQEHQKALATIERILLLFPQAPYQLRDRGLLYFGLGRPTAACLDLEKYLAIAPDAEDANMIRQ